MERKPYKFGDHMDAAEYQAVLKFFYPRKKSIPRLAPVLILQDLASKLGRARVAHIVNRIRGLGFDSNIDNGFTHHRVTKTDMVVSV